MIAGLNRTARRNGLFLSIVALAILVMWAFGAWRSRHAGGDVALATTIVWAPVVLWLGYLAIRTFGLVWKGQRAVFVEDGRLRIHLLFSFSSVAVSEIRGVERAELVTRFARHPGLRIHLASGATRDIATKLLDVHDDEVMRRINALRPIW